MPSPQSRGWIFTAFNADSGEVRETLSRCDLVQFACFQEEVCPDTARDHLQGYVYFSRKKTRTFCRTLLNAHWESRRGTHEEAKTYCTKQDTRREGTEPWIFGVDPAPGCRTDISLARDFILSGATIDQIIDEHPEVLAKYPGFVATCQRSRISRKRLEQMPVLVPRLGWQRDLSILLEGPPDPRKIHWRWEETGNTGKSFFALHFKPNESFVVTNGKHADIYYSYGGERVIFVDWPRQKLDSLPYGMLEAFKNGYFVNTKYQSCPFRFPIPHVVVFANFRPDLQAMSQDRWDIVEIQ